MSVVVDVSLPADQFELGHLLEVRSGVSVRLESMIPTSGSEIPYFWVGAEDAEAVEEALRGSPMVADVDVVERTDEEALFRVAWAEGMNGFVEALGDHGAVVLDGEGHGDRWTFQLRFPEYDALSRFYREVVGKGISVDLQSIYEPTGDASTASFGLTDEQRETLELALARGYFEIPRQVTLVELAEALDISDTAVSQRLRRGLSKILAATVADDAPSR